MATSQEGRAAHTVRRLTERPYAIACGVVESGQVEKQIAPGIDPVDGTTLFEIGSITKTFTATLLAHLVLSGKAALETTLGELLGDSPSAAITLRSLANHTSGLPRLPPNSFAKARSSPDDPYRDYTVDDLLQALADTKPSATRHEYSNFGYMVLGHLVSVIGGAPYPELARKVIFEPLEMGGAQVSMKGFPLRGERIPGYRGLKQVPHWSRRFAGPGGIDAGLDDMVRYLAAQMDPPDGDLGEAIRMTQTPASDEDRVALGWQVRQGLIWHNGGTGGFSTFIGWNPKRRVGIILLANRSPSEDIDRAGFAAIAGD